MNEIYREELMDIYKNPSHKGNLKEADAEIYEENPICGDKINLKIKVKDNIIKEAKFEGSACAVSIISAEKLLDYIEGKSVEEGLKLTQKKLLEILGIKVSMSRLRCATLVLNALHKALENYKKNK